MNFAEEIGISNERNSEIQVAIISACTPQTPVPTIIKRIADRLNISAEAVYAGFQLSKYLELSFL